MAFEPIKANDIHVKLFGNDSGELLEKDMNAWLGSEANNTTVYDIKVNPQKILLNPGADVYPQYDWQFIGVIVHSKAVTVSGIRPKPVSNI
jgi:hypothetical protein